MYIQDIINRINEDIVEIISHYVELKKKGETYVGCCPFHTEKTPSFKVSPAKGIYKCFGCGASGDAINFIQEHEGCEFKEAVKIGAEKLKIDFSWKEDKNFDEEKYKHEEALRIVCRYASEFFQTQLQASSVAKAYLKKRCITYDDDFSLGYAPDKWDAFLTYAREKGLKTKLLIEAGLIKENDKGQLYDYFRNRIIFPICSPTGKVIAFTGRTLANKKDVPKYLNSPETPIFTKGKELFALSLARAKIRNENRVYLVEGNFDVKRLHSIGITNTIAPCGTALTEEQIDLLAKYTRNISLIYDGDSAGLNATNKNAQALIKKNFNVNVIILPEGEDPDTFFSTSEQFEIFQEEEAIDYIIYYVQKNADKCNNPAFKTGLIKDIAFLISRYDEQLQEVYIEAVKEYVKPGKAWKDAVGRWNQEQHPREYKRHSRIPANVSLEEYEQNGFYIDDRNCYFFPDRKKGGDARQVSNFTLRPLFHIESTINAKRTYEVVNEYGITKVIEIAQKDLNMLSGFRLKIESLGNFWWNGTDADLNRLKIWLYAHTESCAEITQLGWHPDGFFAWGNGIFAGNEFLPVDEVGIVKYKDRAYYLPAKSRIYEHETNLFMFEKNFSHMEGNVTMSEYMKKFTVVHGDNGKIGFCFYLACLFRDIIVQKFRVFPLLNMFGPKGSGKSGCAESIVQFFGKLAESPNLFSITKAAMGEHIAAAANALCILDEYRNDLDVEKREILKSIWGGTGRTRMNMDKDKKRETTSVDQGVVVCGQQMADADPALLSRFIFLSFNDDTHTPEERKRYEELKDIEKRGITHITHRLLKLRPVFIESYSSAIKRTQEELEKQLSGANVMDRIFNNWMMILAAYAALEDYLELPWDWNELIRMSAGKIIVQSREGERNDDLGRFWKTIQFLASSNFLYEDGDYKFKYESRVTKSFMNGGVWDKEIIQFAHPITLFYLNPQRALSLYKTQVLREGGQPLPESTVINYLQHSKAFVCETKKESFKKIDPKTGIQEQRDGSKLRTSTSALVFDYDKLPLSIRIETDTAEPYEEPEKSIPDTKQQKLPF